jgi:hypothetical protein
MIYVICFTIIMLASNADINRLTPTQIASTLLDDFSVSEEWKSLSWVEMRIPTRPVMRQTECTSLGSHGSNCGMPYDMTQWYELLPWNFLKMYSGVKPKMYLFREARSMFKDYHVGDQPASDVVTDLKLFQMFSHSISQASNIQNSLDKKDEPTGAKNHEMLQPIGSVKKTQPKGKAPLSAKNPSMVAVRPFRTLVDRKFFVFKPKQSK